MGNTIYSAKVNDIDFKITDNYVQYGSELIPTSAISFVSLTKYIPRWWIPTLFLVGAAIEFALMFSNDYYFDFVNYSWAVLLLIIGLVTLIVAIAKSRKRFLRIYSHSREYLYLELGSGNPQPLIDAIYELLEDKNKPLSESKHSEFMPR